MCQESGITPTTIARRVQTRNAEQPAAGPSNQPGDDEDVDMGNEAEPQVRLRLQTRALLLTCDRRTMPRIIWTNQKKSSLRRSEGSRRSLRKQMKKERRRPRPRRRPRRATTMTTRTMKRIRIVHCRRCGRTTSPNPLLATLRTARVARNNSRW